MPFEGAGAVSEWRLELPAGFRPFDYHSINDVILNISYAAEEDGAAAGRRDAERRAGGALLELPERQHADPGLQPAPGFSTAFNRLIRHAAGTPVDDRH